MLWAPARFAPSGAEQNVRLLLPPVAPAVLPVVTVTLQPLRAGVAGPEAAAGPWSQRASRHRSWSVVPRLRAVRPPWKHRKLSELQGPDPLVLILSRGAFCPKDRRQHEGLVQLHREMEVGYCRMVTIATDSLLELNEFRSGVGAHWTFLSDPGRKVQKDLDIAEYTDPTHNPMVPHTLVLEPDLRIFSVYNGYWFFGRPTVEELRRDLRTVLQRCRPDWDLSDPALRQAWAAGQKTRFYPYGKTWTQVFAEQDKE